MPKYFVILSPPPKLLFLFSLLLFYLFSSLFYFLYFLLSYLGHLDPQELVGTGSRLRLHFPLRFHLRLHLRHHFHPNLLWPVKRWAKGQYQVRERGNDPVLIVGKLCAVRRIFGNWAFLARYLSPPFYTTVWSLPLGHSGVDGCWWSTRIAQARTQEVFVSFY